MERDSTRQKRQKRATVGRRLAEIHRQIEQEKEFREFAASSEMDWEMSDARLEGLRAECRQLVELRASI